MTNIEIKLPEVSADTLGFLQRLLGPVAEASDFLSDKIRYHRWRSSIATVRRAEEFAKSNGVEPQEIPLRLLVPILEKSSLEEESSPLIEKWAALLASTASNPGLTHAVYPHILSQITSEEVAILDRIVDDRFEIQLERATSTDSNRTEPASLLIAINGWRQGWIDSAFDGVQKYLQNNVGDQLKIGEVRRITAAYSKADLIGTICETLKVNVDKYFDELEARAFCLGPTAEISAHAMSALVSCGLLTRSEITKEIDGIRLDGAVISISPVGLGLTRACRPPVIKRV